MTRVSDEHEDGKVPDGLILSVFVPGIPRPKGSLDVITLTHVREANRHSTPWLKSMRDAARRMIAEPLGRPGLWRYNEGYPCDDPVSVDAWFWFPRPARAEFDVPATIRTGDLDKLYRNVLDALTQAKVYTDDARVVDLAGGARYGTTPGARITVRRWDNTERA